MLRDPQVQVKSSWDYIPTSILANSVGSFVCLVGMTETALKKKELWFSHIRKGSSQLWILR